MAEMLFADGPADTLLAAPLLTTKLFIPQGRANLVPRPRLTERLNEELGRRLALVSAPAGFGKTTLLSEWASSLVDGASGVRVGWLSLDEGDNEPARFWAYLVAALQAACPGVGAAAWDLLHAQHSPHINTILATLINDVARLPGEVVAVLDDYHLIDNPAIHAGLSYLLHHLPPQMHLVIAGRADPPLALARLRARGQLVELRTEDLRFTPEEAAAFLSRVLGPDLSPENIATLAARTEGWIAGLQLAVLSLRDRENIDQFIQSFAGDDRYILEYLAEEVLQRQTQSVQTFLLQTSILDRLCGPLCDAVTGRDDGQEMLETLEAANLFTIGLDSRKRWYRYHRLFADLLRHRLHASRPRELAALHRRAATWYEANELPLRALAHAAEAADWENAVRLIEAMVSAGLGRAEAAALCRRLETLPAGLLCTRPLLAIGYAWGLLATDRNDEIEPHLRNAEALLQQAGESDEAGACRWLGQVDALRAAAAGNTGRLRLASELAQRALKRLPEGDQHARSLAALALGRAYAFGGSVDVSEATLAFSQAIAASRAVGDAGLAVMAMDNLASLQMRRGELGQAIQVYTQALALAGERGGVWLPALARVYLNYGEVLRERNDLDAALERMSEGLRLCKQGGRLVDLVYGYVYLARTYLGRGELRPALESSQKAGLLAEGALEANARSVQPEALAWLASFVAENRAWLWLSQGNLEAAERWAAERRLEAGAGIDRRQSSEYATFARLLIAQGRPQEASRILATLLALAERAGDVWEAIHIRALQALSLDAQGDTSGALAALEQALAAAEPAGFVRTFVDKGAPMAGLLARFKERGLGPLSKRGGMPELGLAARRRAGRAQAEALLAYADRLLAAFGPETLAAAKVAAPALVEPLSEREIEVLRLMAAGLSNQEIADQLIVAIGTVKKHTHNIYGKLGVRSRTQALLLARELDLLEP